MCRFGWFSRFFPFIHSIMSQGLNNGMCLTHTTVQSTGRWCWNGEGNAPLSLRSIDCEYAICRGKGIPLIGVDQTSLSLDWKAALCRT